MVSQVWLRHSCTGDNQKAETLERHASEREKTRQQLSTEVRMAALLKGGGLAGRARN